MILRWIKSDQTFSVSEVCLFFLIVYFPTFFVFPFLTLVLFYARSFLCCFLLPTIFSFSLAYVLMRTLSTRTLNVHQEHVTVNEQPIAMTHGSHLGAKRKRHLCSQTTVLLHRLPAPPSPFLDKIDLSRQGSFAHEPQHLTLFKEMKYGRNDYGGEERGGNINDPITTLFFLTIWVHTKIRSWKGESLKNV